LSLGQASLHLDLGLVRLGLVRLGYVMLGLDLGFGLYLGLGLGFIWLGLD